MRDELTRWTQFLSRASILVSKDHQVSEDHRGFLVPIVICILVPKVRNLKKIASIKTTSMHHRRAIIGFLAKLDINELPLNYLHDDTLMESVVRILASCASRIEHVLDTLMESVVRILASCAPNVDETKSMCIQEEDVGEEKQVMASLGPKHFKDLDLYA
ncbi:hypothetical protein Tco_0216370 [Tanacetum coccineum]